MTKKRLKKAIEEIKIFLAQNEISDYEQYESLSDVDKNMIKLVINSYAHQDSEREELNFYLELEICSNKQQLSDLLKKYVKNEEYERCSEITKKMKEI